MQGAPQNVLKDYLQLIESFSPTFGFTIEPRSGSWSNFHFLQAMENPAEVSDPARHMLKTATHPLEQCSPRYHIASFASASEGASGWGLLFENLRPRVSQICNKALWHHSKGKASPMALHLDFWLPTEASAREGEDSGRAVPKSGEGWNGVKKVKQE